MWRGLSLVEDVEGLSYIQQQNVQCFGRNSKTKEAFHTLFEKEGEALSFHENLIVKVFGQIQINNYSGKISKGTLLSIIIKGYRNPQRSSNLEERFWVSNIHEGGHENESNIEHAIA